MYVHESRVSHGVSEPCVSTIHTCKYNIICVEGEVKS